MARTKRERYQRERERIREDVGDGVITEADAEALEEFLDAKNPEVAAVPDPTGDSGKAISTLASYANTLRRLSSNIEFQLVDATPEDLNETFDALRSGEADWVKDSGLAAGTVKNFQTAARKFYEYHDLGVEKEEISLFKNNGTSVDERDVFDKDEIQAIREAAQHPRDKALVDMLLYTGQRISAIATLRLKDINPQEGVFYLNDEADELKGASGKRPLLYAEKSVREWYNKHPCKGDPEAHFITHKYDWETDKMTIGNRLGHGSLHRVLQTIGDRAGVDKPMNAHNFRHTFVTICKRNYEMDNDTIKRLIGHRPDSRIMETTYSHLTDDDVIAAAERATGIRDEEPDSPLTPDICDNCGEPVPIDDAKACASCGILFTPDAQDAKETMQEQAEERVIEVEDETEARVVRAVLQDLRENPADYLDE